MAATPPIILAPGTRIPPEVLRMIVNSLPPPDQTFSGSRDKKGLPALSLTCRDWAILIRPRLFLGLTLRTPDDLSQLLDFFDSPVSVGPALNMCINKILYQVRQDQVPPWIRLHKLLKKCSSALIDLDVKDVPGASLLKTFPRILPLSIFQFRQISLSDITFKNRTEFAPLFHNLAKMQLCNCTSLRVQHTVERTVPRSALGPSQSAQLWFYDVEAGTNDFSTEFNLACTLLFPARRLGLDNTSWNSAKGIILDLVPPHCRVRHLYVSMDRYNGDTYECM